MTKKKSVGAEAASIWRRTRAGALLAVVRLNVGENAGDFPYVAGTLTAGAREPSQARGSVMRCGRTPRAAWESLAELVGEPLERAHDKITNMLMPLQGRPPLREEAGVNLVLRIPPKLKARLLERAAQNETSATAIAIAALEAWLAP